MSDTSPQGFAPEPTGVADAPVGDGQDTGGQPFGQQETDPQVSYESQYSIANDFLKGVPDTDRAIVERYIKQWDGGVTRRFKEIHGSYKQQLAPYQELGANPEQLRSAWQNYQFLSTPEGEKAAYELLRQRFEQEQQQQFQQQQQYPQQQQPYEGYSQLQPQQPQQPQVSPQLQAQLAQQQQLLVGMGNYLMEQRNQQLAAQADQELDQYLGALRAEKGDFNERYVLTLMNTGMSGAEAVDAWRTEINQAQQAMIQRQSSVPPILSGQGMPPQQQRKLGDLSKTDTQSMVAQILARSQQT